MKPYINNPLDNVDRIGDLELFFNYQNIFDRRYSIFSSISSEKLYNYWDRIGDLINSITQVIDNERNVYFANVINTLPDNLRESENYTWLQDFKNNDYTKINEIRKKVVHYRQLETDFATRHLDAMFEREEVEKIQTEKEGYPNFYKTQLNNAIKGFEKCMKFIQESCTH